MSMPEDEPGPTDADADGLAGLAFELGVLKRLRRTGWSHAGVRDAESVADMATYAAEKALAASGLTATDIDLVTVATCSAVDRCPNVATRVAAAVLATPR